MRTSVKAASSEVRRLGDAGIARRNSARLPRSESFRLRAPVPTSARTRLESGRAGSCRAELRPQDRRGVSSLFDAFALFDQFASQHAIQHTGREWRRYEPAVALDEDVCSAAFCNFTTLVEKQIASSQPVSLRQPRLLVVVEVTPRCLVAKQLVAAVDARAAKLRTTSAMAADRRRRMVQLKLLRFRQA